MNYEETLDKIHGFHKFGSKLGLERMKVLMDFLGNPQDKMKVIHVAGTNGKGSVCRYLASMLKENGYKVGLYTSPYLERFTERIEFNGLEISEEDLTKYSTPVFQAIESMLAAGYESPTEFELVTAIGFVYFSHKPMDILVLEVGLGGRGDSTNIINNPLVSVITSISYDHMDVLGNTLAQIAREKAGIIKDGSPVVSSVDKPQASRVIKEVARSKGSRFYDASKICPDKIVKSLSGYSYSACLPSIENGRPITFELSMIGIHQIYNSICALSVIGVLADMGIITYDVDKLKIGLKKAFNKGRLEILREKPLIIIDGAHNEDGIQALARVVNDHLTDKKLLLVIGVLADKKIHAMVKDFSAIPGDIVATEPDNPRKLSSEKLCMAITHLGRDCASLGSWEKAYDYILENKEKYDGIIVSGSLYLIGKFREKLTNETEKNLTNL